jgi:hypothetical protein
MQAQDRVCDQRPPADYRLHVPVNPASVQATGAMQTPLPGAVQTPEKSFTDTLTPKTQAKSSENAPAGVSPPAQFLPTALSYQNALGAGKRVIAHSPPRDPRLQKKPRHAADNVCDPRHSADDGEKDKSAAMSLQGVDLHGVVIKKPHFCGVQRLGWDVFEIQPMPKTQLIYVRQWTKDCKNEPKPLVFDVDGKPLANPAAAKGAVNVIDALKAVGLPERMAQRFSSVDKLLQLGIDPSNIFFMNWDGNPRV